jgi:hypothetical protein
MEAMLARVTEPVAYQAFRCVCRFTYSRTPLRYRIIAHNCCASSLTSRPAPIW